MNHNLSHHEIHCLNMDKKYAEFLPGVNLIVFRLKLEHRFVRPNISDFMIFVLKINSYQAGINY